MEPVETSENDDEELVTKDPPKFALDRNARIDHVRRKEKGGIDLEDIDGASQNSFAENKRETKDNSPNGIESNGESRGEITDDGGHEIPDLTDDNQTDSGIENKSVAMETSGETVSVGKRRHRRGSQSLELGERGIVGRKVNAQNRRRVSRGSIERKRSNELAATLPNPAVGTFLTAPRDQEDMYASRDDDSGFATAREEGSIITTRDEKGTMTFGEMNAGDTSSVTMSYNENLGSFREPAQDNDYSRGLANLRERLKDLEGDIDRCKKDFCQADKTTESNYLKYLNLCNDNLNFCSEILKKNNMQPRKVDSEVRIVAILNDLRITEDPDVDPEILGFITDFWENLKTTCECAVGLNSRFAGSIYKKLKKSCRSGSFQGVDLGITNQYTKDIVRYMNNVEATMSSLTALNKTFQNGLNGNLFSDSGISLKVSNVLNSAQFPVLRLVPDMTEKLDFLCKVAHEWIDRDEAYVKEIQESLSKTRNLKREREEQIREAAIQKRKKDKSLKLAYLVCQNNKKKLQRLEKELEKLHRQVREFTNERKAKDGEKHAKESMLDFLKISISQTKMNYSLQMRKSRLLKQLKDLENSLVEMENQMVSLHEAITEKTLLRQEIEIRLGEDGNVYLDMKKELQDFTENLQHLYQGLQELHETMSHLELLQNIKTSPERIDDFYDRPSSVKLAPSLKEKIRRKRRIQAGTIVVSTTRSTLPRLVSETEDRQSQDRGSNY